MTDLKVSEMSLQSSEDGSLFRLGFSDERRTWTPGLVFDVATMRDTVASILFEAAQHAKPARTLTSQFPVQDTTPHARAIAIEPVEGEPTLARLVVVCGNVDVQFVLPVSELHRALSDLNERIEPDPNSAPMGN